MRINKHKTISNVEEYDLAPYFHSLRVFLERISVELKKKSDIDPTLLDALASAIETIFIPEINGLEADLTVVHAGQPVITNFTNLEKIYSNNVFLQNFDFTNIMLNKLYEERLRATKTNTNLLNLCYSVTLGLVDRCKPINQQLLIGHANSLIEVINDLPELISSTFYDLIHNRLENEVTLINDFHFALSGIIDSIIFKGEFIPAFEFSNIQTNINDNNITFSKANINERQTTAKLIGSSFSLLMKKIFYLENNTQTSDSVDQYRKLIFSAFNKLMNLMGYYKFNSEENYGMFIPFLENESRSRIDIRTYYKDTGSIYYGLPDKIYLYNGFEMDYEKTNQNLKSSLISQAELISGMSQLLDHLRPDKTNVFDKNLSNIMIEDNYLFSKESFYVLQLGLISVFLSNFQRNGTLLYDENGDHKQLSHNTIDDLSNVVLISMNDIDASKNSELIIKTKDISRVIEAMDLFLKSVDTITPNSFKPGSAFRELFEKEFDSLLNFKEQIRNSILGLGFFMTSKLQYPDAGFSEYYNVETKKRSQKLTLESQIYALKGLITMYNHRWESELVKVVIIDILRTLNSRLYKEDLGFYSVSETEKNMPNLSLITELFNVFYEIKKILPNEDKLQLENALQLWNDKFSNQIGRLI